MIRAELRGLHSPDVYDLQSYIPEDPLVFGFLVQAFIGPIGEMGEESFNFIVRSPQWIAENELSDASVGDQYLFARHYLILHRYSYEVLLQAISKLCDSVQGPDWETIAERLGRYGYWEFEDYVPYR